MEVPPIPGRFGPEALVVGLGRPRARARKKPAPGWVHSWTSGDYSVVGWDQRGVALLAALDDDEPAT
jgi:hypothetical protein